LVIGIENLIEFGGFGIFDVDDGDALFAGGDVGVGAGDVDVAGVGERDVCAGKEFGLREICLLYTSRCV